MKQITTVSDILTKKNIINRISDVPGGVSLDVTALNSGKIVPEASPISAPISGIRHICKQAKLLAGSALNSLKVDASSNHFKVGNFVGSQTGGKAYPITDVSEVDGVATLTLSVGINSAAEGIFIYEMAEQSVTASALKYAADVILKSPFQVPAESQVLWASDAFVRADILEGVIGDLYFATLPGILTIKY